MEPFYRVGSQTGGCGNRVDIPRPLTGYSHFHPPPGVHSLSAFVGQKPAKDCGASRGTLWRAFQSGRPALRTGGRYVMQMIVTQRPWGVACLHCGEVFPVPFEPAPASDSGHELEERGSGRVFLAWCPTCDREAPYSTEQVVRFESAGRGAAAAAGAL